MKKLQTAVFVFLALAATAQTNSYPTSGDVRIFPAGAAWSEGIAIIRATGWSGIRFDRNDPATGIYHGNWALGHCAATGNDLSFSTHNGSAQYDGVLHLSNSTRNIGVGTVAPDWHFEVGGSGSGKGIIMASGDEAFVGWYDRSLKSASINNRWGWYANNGSTHLWDQLNSASRMTITNGGNVGIGTATPGSRLSVVGSQSVEESVVNVSNAVDQDFLVRLSAAGASTKRTIIGPSTANRFSLAVGAGNEHLTIVSSGNVGIGTTNPTQKLTVKGTLYSTEVKVDINAGTGPDYVFDNEYALPSLESIQTYISQNNHLPEVPSAKEMEANGIYLSEMNMLLLKKVEELTLHLIKQNETIESQNKRIENLERSKK